MEISISSVLHSPQSTTYYPFEERIPLPSDEEQLLEPVTGELTIQRTSTQVLTVTGEFHTRLKLNCDRCGNEFELPVDFSLDEPLQIVEGPITSEEVEEVVNANGSLDATDLIRQGLLLSLPSRRLCGCEPPAKQTDEAPIDPRWAALKSLENNSNGKK
jgi:uncharacterized metal-binding protein YceD (DUF177 family)